jgi:hypothetical protein
MSKSIENEVKVIDYLATNIIDEHEYRIATEDVKSRMKEAFLKGDTEQVESMRSELRSRVRLQDGVERAVKAQTTPNMN